MALGERFATVLGAAGEGAEWAWAELYRDLAPRLLRFIANQGVGDPEDCLGECFVQIVRNLPAFEGGEDAFRAWTFRIARSRVVDSWRAAGRRPTATGNVQEAQDIRHHQESPETRMVEHDSASEVLARLSPDQRAVVVLRVLERFSVEETATVLGRSPGAIRVQQSRALKRLREVLGPARDASSRPKITSDAEGAAS